MSKGFKYFGVLLSLVAILGLVAGCGGGGTPTPTSSSPTSPTASPTQQPAKEIVVGVVGPLTGEGATFGKSTQQGAELARDEWNAKGGVLGAQIKLVIADDKGDPTEAAAAWTRLIEQDKVVAIIGTVFSKCSLAGAPICQDKKIPMMATVSTNPKVTEVGDFIFRACYLDSFQGTVAAKFAYNDLGIRKAACIFDIGNDYTKGLSEFFRDSFEQLGGEIVAFEGHSTGTTDFNAQLTKIISARPDLIYIPDYYNDAGLIMKQARALGFEGQFLGADGWDSPDLAKIGGDAIEGAFFTNHFSKDDPRPEVQNFVKVYTDKFGEPPDCVSNLVYDSCNLIFDAIQRAGSTDGTAIRDALKNTSLDCVGGHYTFDENRNPVKSIVILEIKNGQQVYKATVQP